jgi:hypothetical protein
VDLTEALTAIRLKANCKRRRLDRLTVFDLNDGWRRMSALEDSATGLQNCGCSLSYVPVSLND